MTTLTGIVTSVARQKTATVNVVHLWQHHLYKKYVNRSKKYSCHVEGIELQIGDKVLIAACKPVSKTKYFEIIKKLEN